MSNTDTYNNHITTYYDTIDKHIQVLRGYKEDFENQDEDENEEKEEGESYEENFETLSFGHNLHDDARNLQRLKGDRIDPTLYDARKQDSNELLIIQNTMFIVCSLVVSSFMIVTISFF